MEAAACEDFPAIVAVGRFCHGRVLSARGEHESGLETMRQAIETYRGAGQKVGLPNLLLAVAEAHAASGDVAAAFACVGETRAALESAGEIRYLAELHRVEGTLHAARGERSVAERCFRHAIDVARRQGERWSELRATISIARLVLDGGAQRSRRATRDELAALVASFSEGFDTPDLLEARRLLERGRS